MRIELSFQDSEYEGSRRAASPARRGLPLSSWRCTPFRAGI